MSEYWILVVLLGFVFYFGNLNLWSFYQNRNYKISSYSSNPHGDRMANRLRVAVSVLTLLPVLALIIWGFAVAPWWVVLLSFFGSFYIAVLRGGMWDHSTLSIVLNFIGVSIVAAVLWAGYIMDAKYFS